MIYLLRAADRIKIGYAEDVAARLKTLQTANPTPLRLLATLPGDRHAETDLHRRFAHLRTSGEWFQAADELLAFASALASNTQETFSMTTQPATASPLVFTTLSPTAPPPRRLSTSLRALDRVLGGGLVPASTTLLSGDPGAGKSTLLLQVAAYVACRGYHTTYVTAEEAPEQLQHRAARLGLAGAPVALAATADVAALVAALSPPNPAPTLLIVDSLQRFVSPASPSPAGSPTQTHAVLAALIAHAHRHGTATIIVSHVNKQNRASGANDLQHDVDVLLHLSAIADRRVLRARKNRYGPTDQEAAFRMTPEGIRE